MLNEKEILYKKWIESIALNTNFNNVLEHLEKHLNENADEENFKNINPKLKWKLSLINLLNILIIQLSTSKDINNQIEIIYQKSLQYKENSDNPESFFENKFIKEYEKITNK